MRCSHLRVHLFGWPLLLLATPLFAQPAASADSLRQTVDRLTQQVQTLQDQINTLYESLPRPAQPTLFDPSEELLVSRKGYALPPRKPASLEPLEIAAPAPTNPAAPPLEISGYMDASYQHSIRQSDPTQTQIGQVELDVGRELGGHSRVDLALVQGDGQIEIGWATIAYDWLGGADQDRDGFWQHVASTVGLMDVPFGLDYEVYSSIDRRSVTQPSVVPYTFDSWSDIGALGTFGSRLGVLDVYAVKGFDSRVWTGEEAVNEDVAADDEHWAICSPAISAGARWNMPLNAHVETGLSAAHGWLANQRTAMDLLGAHARFTWSTLALKAEAIQHVHGETLQQEIARGAYAEAVESLGRFYGVARYDYVEIEGTPEVRACSVGAGVHLLEHIQLRSEYRWHVDTPERQLLMQVAAGF
jgi:hypothetical protein